jgi:hypothetical protein
MAQKGLECAAEREILPRRGAEGILALKGGRLREELRLRCQRVVALVVFRQLATGGRAAGGRSSAAA